MCAGEICGDTETSAKEAHLKGVLVGKRYNRPVSLSRQNERNLAESVVVEGDQSKRGCSKDDCRADNEDAGAR